MDRLVINETDRDRETGPSGPLFVGSATTLRREPVPVLIFGTSITALGVLRVFARSGVPTFVYTAPGDLVTLSRYYKSMPVSRETWSFIKDGGITTAATLEAILRGLPFEQGVIFPCTDLWMEAAASLPESLRERFPCSIAPPDAIVTLLDKGRLAATMRSLNLPHPKSVSIESAADFNKIDIGSFHAAFLKPRSSARFISKFKVKAFRVQNREDAIARFKEITAAGFSVVLQEYIPGPATEHYFIDGFMDKAGVVRSTFARRRLRMYPPDFGNSTCMESVPMRDVAPAMKSLDSLLSHVRFRGIFSAEFKRDPRNGNFCLLEVNVRPWWYVDFAEHCGAGICAMAYVDALGLPLPEQGSYKNGVRCVYPYFDYEGYCWRRRNLPRAERGASLLQHVFSWMTARQPIFCWSDPGPAWTNFTFLLKRYLRNHLWRKKS